MDDGADSYLVLVKPLAPVQDKYPDRGQSPERLQEVAASKAKGVNLTAPQQKAAYVPPSQRGAGGARVPKQIEGFDADEAADRIRQMKVCVSTISFFTLCSEMVPGKCAAHASNHLCFAFGAALVSSSSYTAIIHSKRVRHTTMHCS